MPTSGSLYIHIPFCSRKCGYCHFYVLPDKQELKEQLLQGLALEWQRLAPKLQNSEIVSVYFGGGTPALFGPERIATVLSWIRSLPSIRNTLEVTLEANPEESHLSLLKEYASAGVNRLSIGVQSFHDPLLTLLTRQHNTSKACQTILDAEKAGFSNISIDLMYDIPTQTLSAWQQTLRIALTLPITHLSLYNLTIEPHTSFYQKKEQLQRLRPPEEESKQMYEMARTELSQAGLLQYEISAFARTGYPSIHNSGYWTGRPFLGLGPSAFSYWKGKRFRNQANLKGYTNALQAGLSPVDFEEELPEDAARREQLVLQLRLTEGVPLSRFTQRWGPLEKSTQEALQALQAQGLLDANADTIRLTARGQLFYDTIASELI